MKIVLISCVKRKKNIRTKAENLYGGPLFKNSLCVAKKLKPDKIFILSAEHYLLRLEAEIDPYNSTLNNFSASEKKAWGIEIIKQLKEVSDLEKDEFIILAGKNYINPLIQTNEIKNLNNFLQNKTYGQRTSYLKTICDE